MTKSITVTSAIKNYGNFFTVSYHGHKTEVGKEEENGIGLVIFDQENKGETPNFHRVFDFSKESDRDQIIDQFQSKINSVKEGSYIVMGLKGEVNGITKEVKEIISRIGIRFLIGQHIALKKQLQSNDVSSDSPFVGLVCKKVKPYDVAKEAIADASYVCEREYGRVPNVVLEGLTSMSFPYISSHVYYILFEILKNSMAATLEFHSNKDPSSGGYLDSNTNSNPLPPIKMIIADGEEHEDCSIRISDEGGGMPRSRFDRAFDFGFSIKQIDLSKVDDIEDFTTSMPMSGLGVGLTVSRLYCKYFGGDIRMVPMEGYGTDTYIYLHRLLEKSEPHVPLPR